MSTAFRSAPAVSESAPTTNQIGEPTGPFVDKPTEMSPILYRDSEKKPYAAKFFEMEGVYGELDSDFVGHIDNLDDYFVSLSKKGEFENSKTGYQDFIRKYERLTDTKHSNQRTKITAISEFIKYLVKREAYG